MTDYTLDFMIERAYDNLDELQVEIKKPKLILSPPIVTSKDRKTYFSNFVSTCKELNRDQHDVFNFFTKEFNTMTTVTADGVMILHNMFKVKHVENVLVQYIMKYVTCPVCKSGKTKNIKKERLLSIDCDTCKSCTTVV